MLVAIGRVDGGLAYLSLAEREYQYQARWKGLSEISPEQEQAARA